MRPSCASKRKTGKKETTMITSEKKMADQLASQSPTEFSASAAREEARFARLTLGKLTISVFDHHNGGVHQDPNR